MRVISNVGAGRPFWSGRASSARAQLRPRFSRKLAKSASRNPLFPRKTDSAGEWNSLAGWQPKHSIAGRAAVKTCQHLLSRFGYLSTFFSRCGCLSRRSHVWNTCHVVLFRWNICHVVLSELNYVVKRENKFVSASYGVRLLHSNSQVSFATRHPSRCSIGWGWRPDYAPKLKP